MNKSILGIDLGTSSVKMLLMSPDGIIKKSKSTYLTKTPDGWILAIKNAFKVFKSLKIDAISLSSQVGTYIINDEHVISWNSGLGKNELDLIKEKYKKETFIKEISMPHPDISSYPIPRLLYIKNHYKNIKTICQPKDFICKILTGEYVTDKYSYRGLTDTKTGKYSSFFLNEIGIDEAFLPAIMSSSDIIGVTNDDCEAITGIPKGIPVFTGLNDFFASIVGMGIKEYGDMFDITGTSEHLGFITDTIYPDTKMVSCPYFNKFIHYGVTASSGASLDFAISELDIDINDINSVLKNNPPIFTPYLNGERAPVFDSDAKGVFFGIKSDTSKKDMGYSVLEGVVFSLYHIYENMGMPEIKSIRVCGGASNNELLNTLKAEMFNTTVYTLTENDTSALGAICIALEKSGFRHENINPITKSFIPEGIFDGVLKDRYEIYKSLYPSLKNQFKKFSNIRKDLIL